MTNDPELTVQPTSSNDAKTLRADQTSLNHRMRPPDDVLDQIAAFMAGVDAPNADDAGSGTDIPEGESEGSGDPERQDEGGEFDGEGEEQGSDDAGTEGEASTPPATLTEAAERLGLDPADFYALTLNASGDGEPVTLGQLKDAYQERESAAVEITKRETALDEREAALQGEQRLWGQIGQTLSEKLTPAQVQTLQKQMADREQAERRAMVQAIPEFADQAAFGQFRDDATKTLAAYGYSPQEMSIVDHRQIVMLRDLMRMKSRLDRLDKWKPERKPPATSQTRSTRKTQTNAETAMATFQRTGGRDAELDAIAALMNEG